MVEDHRRINKNIPYTDEWHNNLYTDKLQPNVPQARGRFNQVLRKQLVYEIAPCNLSRSQCTPILCCGFLYVTGSAKRLEIVERPSIAALAKRDNVIDFVCITPTGSTAPICGIEHLAPDGSPAVGIQAGVVSAYVRLCEIEFPSDCTD